MPKIECENVHFLNDLEYFNILLNEFDLAIVIDFNIPCHRNI